MEGWIKIHRKIIEHWIWKNEKYLQAWLWFLIRANHKKTKVLIGSELIELEKGEFITSIQKICNATGLTNQNARTFLDLLEKDKMINKQSNTKLTKLTILNYDRYQVNQQTSNKQTNKPVTNGQQTSNKPVTTDNNVKKEKELKDNKDIPTWDEFRQYALEKKQNIDQVDLKLKYDSWIENNWKDGNDKQIKNWKSKLLNTLPYIKEKKEAAHDRTVTEGAPDNFGVISETAITREEYLKQK